MSVLMVSAKVKEEKVSDVEAAVGRVFESLDSEQPGNVRYASCRSADGLTFVVLLEVADDTENPLPSLPVFREFQACLADWVVEPPSTDRLTVVGSYRLFDR